MKSEGQKAAVVDINPIVVLVIVSIRYDQYDDQHTNYKGIKEKFLISQEIRNFSFYPPQKSLLYFQFFLRPMF